MCDMALAAVHLVRFFKCGFDEEFVTDHCQTGPGPALGVDPR
eukprot:CAMPEP_0172185342 /NCGR_PEP_ID=MMETSP1050-20130122/20113_1 /TAXON_ID=233186 /ORGANISM="Cryptomonas curvata, Strain CCAP979/52" /LENGTH=41 /DNA_ID= /DNA_START= /DNA_END= /DNA_ORIENTATION=